jgi:hypothetical protein
MGKTKKTSRFFKLEDLSKLSNKEKFKKNLLFYLGVIVLWILNIGDMIFTRIFVESQRGKEANPLMVNVMNDWCSAIMVKVVFLGLLLFGLSFCCFHLYVKVPKIVTIVIWAVVLLYLILNVYYSIILIFDIWRV